MSREKDRIIKVNPAIIRFTHSRIRPHFSGNGLLIADTIEMLETKKITIDAIPLIQVMFINNEYYSMNNRRLYTFKHLNKLGMLDEINCRIKVPNKKEILKYTPENCALSAKIIREKE